MKQKLMTALIVVAVIVVLKNVKIGGEPLEDKLSLM